MQINHYELLLLVEAIESNLVKVKRPRGSCEKITMVAPITKNLPSYLEGM